MKCFNLIFPKEIIILPDAVLEKVEKEGAPPPPVLLTEPKVGTASTEPNVEPAAAVAVVPNKVPPESFDPNVGSSLDPNTGPNVDWSLDTNTVGLEPKIGSLEPKVWALSVAVGAPKDGPAAPILPNRFVCADWPKTGDVLIRIKKLQNLLIISLHTF